MIRALLYVLCAVFPMVTAAQGLNVEVSPGKMTRIAKPGETFVQTLRIGNYADTERTFHLSTADFVVEGETGAPTFTDGETHSRYALSSWMTLPQTTVTVPAGEVATVDVTVTVPDDALPGGHYGAVFVQTDDPSLTQRQEGSVIGAIGRIASLFLVTVPGDVAESVVVERFAPERTVYWSAHPTVQLTTVLRNEGTVHAIPTGAMFVSGGLAYRGQSIMFNTQQGAVMPDAPPRVLQESFTPRAHALLPPMGRFRVQLVAKYGLSAQTLSAETVFYIIPVKVLVVLFFAALLVVVIVYRAALSFRSRT